MDLSTEALLESAAKAANWTALQKEDWRRFYAFVIHVHASNLRIPPETVRRRLLCTEFAHPHVPVALPNGAVEDMATHVINGIPEEIKLGC